ncbi:MAG: T9SS type A sorting domain-containing protein [Ignavibacteriaceae bacterium]|nr:T9SS type A sorting domain-containing protein [Ignavibacteriaceae bacterium]
MTVKSIIAILLLHQSLYAQNVMSVSSHTVHPGDTVSVSLLVTNTQQFVGFQAAMQFAPGITPVQNSAVLTGRANGHVLAFQVNPQNTATVLSFSLMQIPFLGDSGAVLTMKVIAGNIAGSYPISLSEAVISNAASQNILDSASGGTITIEENVVAVELTSFSLLRKDDHLLEISWSTASEYNCKEFRVERITKKQGDYKILSAEGAGTTASPRSYRLTDTISYLSGKIVYRLWETEFTGVKTLLGEKELWLSSEDDFRLLQNYPNPFNPATTIHFFIAQNDDVQLEIVTVNGEIVWRLSPSQVKGGYNKIIWNGKTNAGEQLPSGVYLIRLKSKNSYKTNKILLMQ